LWYINATISGGYTCFETSTNRVLKPQVLTRVLKAQVLKGGVFETLNSA